MSETNMPRPDDMISRGEVFEHLIGAKPSDEDGIFTDSDRETATKRLVHLLGGSSPEILVGNDAGIEEDDNISKLF